MIGAIDHRPNATRRPRAAWAFLAAILAFPTFAAGQDAAADLVTDRRCAKGADVRRIEIRFADADGSLPCKVIYRPEAESDTLGIVSWQDIDSLEACRAQAKEVTDRLSVEGWTCADDWTAQPEEDKRLATLLAAELVAGEPPAEDAAAPIVEDADAPAIFVDNPDLPAPPAELVSLIQADLNRLDRTLDGVLEAQIAGYGDLNADDVDDALVLYTYTSPQPAYRQVLMAYAFDGESYQLVATRPVGSTSQATMAATIEAIDQGVIHMTLQAFEPGDPACCPSGERRLALALRDLDLVEIDADVPTR